MLIPPVVHPIGDLVDANDPRKALCGVKVSHDPKTEDNEATVTDGRTLINARWKGNGSDDFPREHAPTPIDEIVPAAIWKDGAKATRKRPLRKIMQSFLIEADEKDEEGGSRISITAIDPDRTQTISARKVDADQPFPHWEALMPEFYVLPSASDDDNTAVRIDVDAFRLKALMAALSKIMNGHHYEPVTILVPLKRDSAIKFVCKAEGAKFQAIIMPLSSTSGILGERSATREQERNEALAEAGTDRCRMIDQSSFAHVREAVDAYLGWKLKEMQAGPDEINWPHYVSLCRSMEMDFRAYFPDAPKAIDLDGNERTERPAKKGPNKEEMAQLLRGIEANAPKGALKEERDEEELP